MAMIGKVKRMYFREKKSVREIVRLTSLSRNTVRKWLKAAVVEEPRYRRSEAPAKLTPFHESIRQALKVDRRTMTSPFLCATSMCREPQLWAQLVTTVSSWSSVR